MGRCTKPTGKDSSRGLLAIRFLVLAWLPACVVGVPLASVQACAAGKPAGPATRGATTRAVTQMTIDIDEKVKEQIRESLRSEGGGGTIQLELKGVEVPIDADVVLRVFVNKPDASPKTSADDPSHVSTLGFFRKSANAAAGEDKKQSFLLDATPALNRLAAKGELNLDKGVSIQLVPVVRRTEKGAPAVSVDKATLTTVK